MRARRGTLNSEHSNGRLYVWLDTDSSGAHAQGQVKVSELRDRIRFREGQLRREQNAHSEARRLVAALIQRVPELEAPSEPQSATERADNGLAWEEAQDPSERV